MINARISIRTDSFNDPNGRVSDRDFSGTSALKDLLLFVKGALLSEARAQIKEELAKGFDPQYLTIVDNSKNKRIEDVNPIGKIEFTSRATATDILIPIYRGLIQRSRVDTGLYKKSNYVFYNGRIIATDITQLEAFLKRDITFKTGDSIRFLNVVPYAGKLERDGVTSDRVNPSFGKSKDKRQRSGSFVRMPNGVYFLTFRSIQRLFKNNASIKFEWVNGSTISGLPRLVNPRTGRLLRREFHPSSNRKGSYVYPSIVVRINEEGIFK